MLPYIQSRRQAGQPLALAVEINANLPYMPGAAEMDASECDVVLETEHPHYELFAPPKEPVSLHDYAMALHAATLIKDGGTLQIGIGSFSDALTHALILRHKRNGDFRALLGKLGARLAGGCRARPLRDRPLRLHRDAGRRLPRPAARRHPAPPRRRRRRPRGGAACRVLRRQPGLLSRAARDAARGARAHRHDRHLLHQHARRRCSGQARAAPPRPLRQHRHGGDPARRRLLRSARGRPRRQRRRRPARPRRHGPRAGGRPLHHRRAQPPGAPTAAPPPTSSGATPTPRCRGSCATSSSPSTGSPICAASPTAMSSSPCSAVADSGFQPGLARGGPPCRQARALLPPARHDAQPGGADRGRPGAGQARRPAAGLPAGHRDDRGRAGARRPAHVPEVGRLRRPGADAACRPCPRIRLGPASTPRSNGCRSPRRPRCATARCAPSSSARCGGAEQRISLSPSAH